MPTGVGSAVVAELASKSGVMLGMMLVVGIKMVFPLTNGGPLVVDCGLAGPAPVKTVYHCKGLQVLPVWSG
jgi:hypothetical protein